MGGEYYRLTPHQQRARCAVQHEREGYYHQAANAWQSVARLAPKADASESTAEVIKTPASLSALGTLTVRKGKKTIVNVTQPPRWKKKKPTAPQSPVTKKEKQKPAPKPNPAPVVKILKKVKPPRSPRRVTLAFAIAQLAPHWPKLFNPPGLKLMTVGLQEQLLQDIQSRHLPLSNKVARRCLHAVSHNPEYLTLMVAGMPRYGLNGEEQGLVTKAEQDYAFEKMSEIWQSRIEKSTLNGESNEQNGIRSEPE